MIDSGGSVVKPMGPTWHRGHISNIGREEKELEEFLHKLVLITCIYIAWFLNNSFL